VLVLAASIAFVAATGMRPSFDPFGWMVWGRQTLHWNLNTDGAPSWKPLTFLFTLPYALFGHVQIWLWTVTSVAGTLGGSVFAARIAYRLAAPVGPVPRWARLAPWFAGAFAAVALPGLQEYAHWTLIANSDQLNVTLLLAAIDAHLSGRPPLAFWALVLAALGRPEVWPFAGLYGAWLFRREPAMRFWVVVGLVLIPALWFSVPALTSKSWLRPGDLALNQKTIIHGNKVIGVLGRWRGLYEVPMQVGALLGVIYAAIRRDRVTLGLTACAVLWVIIEIAFAYHGWSAVARYLLEPAAVMVVIAAGFAGRLIADAARLPVPAPLRLAGPALALVLLALLIPAARNRVHVWHTLIDKARGDGHQIDRLGDLVAEVGGGKRIRACGQPVARNASQSTLAYYVGVNVGAVGYNVARTIARGKPVVVFRRYQDGWRVQPYNLAPGKKAACARLTRIGPHDP
jgi:hypothetical protein